MHKTKLLYLVAIFLVAFITTQKAFCEVLNFSKSGNGIIIHFKKTIVNGPKALKLEVISENIIHVLASPTDSFSSIKSLMAIPLNKSNVKWDVIEKDNNIVLSTALINATINITTGSIGFTDKNGKSILAEKEDRSKIFIPTVVDGEMLYQLKQIFNTPSDEAFYGLGQHQNGIMNYRNNQVDLSQNNTDVAVPFLVSSKNYGILWDNYSVTKVVDSREYEQMGSLKLFSKDGKQGWLTATYYSDKSKPDDIFTSRPESKIDYGYLNDMKNFPEEFKLEKGMVTWEGSIQSDFTGVHKFMFKYAGYAKLWIDGKLLADRWRQAWNPGSAVLDVNMVKGIKQSFKIEWIPCGTESFIGCKWLQPLEAESSNEYSFKSEAGNQIDYYFIYGKNIDDVIGGYREITGRATLLPKWAMGLWQSRERYKSADEILQTVSEFRKRQIPLDNIVLDWSYWETEKWGSQEFDKTRFPDPAGMIKTLHEKYNTHFMISVWPKFYEGIESYKYFNANNWLYKRNIENKQRDWIGKGYISTFYDAFNDKARVAFWDLMNKHLYSKGVDAWWLDASEPDMYSNVDNEQKKQLMSPTAIGSSTQYFNAYPLQNAKGVYEGQRSTNANQRIFILTRSAYAGIQRYAATTWSGDIAARWHDFKDQIPAGINFSLSGLPYWTTDIGGFAVEPRYETAKGNDLEEWRELSTRWYQFGSFCPLFRVHGQFPYREIYNISPEGTPAYESMLYYDKLRYRLMPYIYSLAGKTYHENYTIMRGLIMDFTNDPQVRNIGNQFMFGPSILVNPVTDFHATERAVYLPASTGWFDFYTGKYYTGGQTITANAPLQQIPLYIKEGSVIPFGPELQYTSEKQADIIRLMVYTGKNATFAIYEDENTNYNYEKGKYATIPISYIEGTKTLSIGERKGEFAGMLKERTFQIVWIKKDQPKSFNLKQKPDATIKYSGKRISVSIK